MPPNPLGAEQSGLDFIINIPFDGQPAADFDLSYKFPALTGGGRYIFRPQEVFYTNEAVASGASEIVINETPQVGTPLKAAIFIFNGTDFDRYEYDDFDESTRTFFLKGTTTQAYTAGEDVKLESPATPTISIENATFDFRLGQGSDQIHFLSERELTLIIPAGLANFSQTVDTEEIFFQSSGGADFLPSDLDGTYGDVEEFKLAPEFWDNSAKTWEAVSGRLRMVGGGESFNITYVSGAQNYIDMGDNSWFEFEEWDPVGEVWNAVDVTYQNFVLGVYYVQSDFRYTSATAADTGFDHRINSGQVNANAGWSYNFNAAYSSGEVIYQYTPFYNNDDSTAIPQSTYFVISGQAENPKTIGILNSQRTASFAAEDGTRFVGLILTENSVTVDDDRDKLTRHMCFAIEDAGHTNPLSSTYPDQTRPQGGTAAAVTLDTPALTVTFQNAPAGSALNVWDDEDEDSSADHGTLLFTATPDGADKIWDSGVTAGNRVIVQWIPASPYVFKEINFPYTVPSSSANFDFTPLLEDEDGI